VAAHQGAGGGVMSAVAQVFATLFSRPRLTWAALAVAAAAFLLSPSYIVGLADEATPFGPARLGAITVLFVALAFLTLTIGIDAAQAVSRRWKANVASVSAARKFLELPPDAKAILKYLAVNSENCLWIKSDHPGVYPLRRSQFLYISTNRGDFVELETRSGVYEWLQRELDLVTGTSLSDEVRDRLLSAIQEAAEASANSWMYR